jgi:hypothetical protein
MVICPICKREFPEIPAGSVCTVHWKDGEEHTIQTFDYCPDCWRAFCLAMPDEDLDAEFEEMDEDE